MNYWKPDHEIVNILIIDDDEDDFFITSEYIKKINNGHSYKIDWCGSYKEALDEICQSKHHIYFVDFYLGGKTGLDLIKDSVSKKCEQPMILLTGRGNKEIDERVMEAGAVDYLIKSELNAEKIERSIRYALARHEFLKALKANEQKFRNFFEKSIDSVFLADTGLMFLDMNPSTNTLTGYSRNELFSLSLYDLLANKEDKSAIENELREFGEVVDKEIEILNKQNEKISCIFSVSGEKDERGQIYVQGIIHDISILKKSERITLQTEKLKATQRLLQTLAHEVRNPINNIFLALEVLTPTVLEEQPKAFLDIITRNSKRINVLISELLDSSRPAEMVPEKISLQTALEETVAIAMDRITLKHIKLTTAYLDKNAWVLADLSKIKIAFLNIIINAIEAIEEDNGKLSISLKQDGMNYVVSIADNGMGISEENLGKLFEPYYTSKTTGIGMGLAATLNILQSHNASIEVDSQLGKGTRFIISFPVIK